MKNMKLGLKIALGFGVLIVIACILGGLAVWNMKSVETQSAMLAQEYVPEVKLANEIERHSLETMYAMRGYGLSEEKQYLEAGRENLKGVEEHVAEAKELAENATHLVKLHGAVSDIQEHVDAYKKLVEETVSRNKGIASDRSHLDAAAASYMKNCNDFLAGQNEAMQQEIRAGATPAQLEERLEKITLVNDIIDVGNWTRVACFKSQALRDPKVIQDAQKNFHVMNTKFQQLRAITKLDVDIERIEKTKAAAEEYKKAMNHLLENWIVLQDLGTQRTAAGDAVLKASRELAMAGIGNTEEIAKGAVSSLSSSSIVMIVGLTVAVAIGIFVAVFITRGITKPVNRIVNELNEGADQVASASGQVSSASQSLAEGTSEQAASLEETSSSLEEMSSMTKQNADNAGQADNLMNEANQIVQKANGSMTELTTSMVEISKASEETSKIIKTIDEIAFQTNLLALNAAVEAARAGEAGAGFAVVADEVRNLAMRAADAAKNTADLIEGTVKKVKDGSELVTSTNEAFQEVATSAGKVGELVSEISAASNEQSQGIEQINTAVSEMDKVVQGAAANAEESASASEEMNAQAEQMRSIVSELSAMVNGSGGGSYHGTTQKNKNEGAKTLVSKLKSGLPQALTNRGNTDTSNHKQLASHRAPEVPPEQVIPMDEEEFKDF